MTGARAAANRLAPLLVAVTAFEEMSRDITRRQSALATAPGLARALLRQSHQEAAHAALFHGALRLTGVRATCPSRLDRALAACRSRLADDLERGDLACSMLGLHRVLEGLGSVALQPPAGDLGRLGNHLVPLRALVLKQEEAHQQLGELWVERLGDHRRPALQQACRTYVELADEVADAGLSAFDGYCMDRALYLAGSRVHLDRIRAAFA